MITTVKDYLDKVCEEFPDIDKNDIRQIINYGFLKMINMKNKNHDLALNSKGLHFYLGKCTGGFIHPFRDNFRAKARKTKYVADTLGNFFKGYYYVGLNAKKGKNIIKLMYKKRNTDTRVVFKKSLFAVDPTEILKTQCIKYVFKVRFNVDVGAVYFSTHQCEVEDILGYMFKKNDKWHSKRTIHSKEVLSLMKIHWRLEEIL